MGRTLAGLWTPLSRPAPGPARVRERLRGGRGGVRLRLGAGERLVRAPGGDGGGGARERAGREGEGSPASLPFSPRPSGVRSRGRKLLQEMHPDSRRHVQRRALLSPLQGEGYQQLGRDQEKRWGGTNKGRDSGGRSLGSGGIWRGRVWREEIANGERRACRAVCSGLLRAELRRVGGELSGCGGKGGL